MRTPRKPFPGFKWKWASNEPTEGLNEPPIYLGVLRALYRCEGLLPSSAQFQGELKRVEREVKGRVRTTATLARLPERNLLRNSGQYWRMSGLLVGHGPIALSPLGKAMAKGDVTQDEFASLMVAGFRLPNPIVMTQDEVRVWAEAGITIRPLDLILQVMASLDESLGSSEAYLTVDELIHIVIPLSGEGSEISRHARAIREFRAGRLVVSSWPNCVPKANDKRVAKEFLLFLAHHGFCRREKGEDGERFVLVSLALSELVEEIRGADPLGADVELALKEVNEVGLPELIQRGRVLSSRLDRPGQASFRRKVLEFYKECVLTAEGTPDVLIAAHIIPVENGGPDAVANALCLRSDIHILFDLGRIRIEPTGAIHLATGLRRSPSYSGLPGVISLPRGVRSALEWRLRYC